MWGTRDAFEDEAVPDYHKIGYHRASIGEVGFDGKNVYHPEIYSDYLSYCDVYLPSTGATTYYGQEIVHDGVWTSPYSYVMLLKNKFAMDKRPSEVFAMYDVLSRQPGYSGPPIQCIPGYTTGENTPLECAKILLDYCFDQNTMTGDFCLAHISSTASNTKKSK